MKRGAGFGFGFGSVVVLVLVVAVAVSRVGGDEGGMVEKCTNDFQKVIGCLDFVTGKADAPSTGCCGSIKEIKDGKPECLCFFIQQTHNGSQQIKALGIQETKLLQLPSACSLKNSNLSYCPKLLGISPNSPDAAIFSSSSSSPTAPTKTTPSTTSPSGSSRMKITPHYCAALMAMAVAVFFIAFPASPFAFPNPA